MIRRLILDLISYGFFDEPRKLPDIAARVRRKKWQRVNAGELVVILDDLLIRGVGTKCQTVWTVKPKEII